jgi:rSAM/selenodomain-associated transferase 2
MLAIVFPTLNAEAVLLATLAALAEAPAGTEVIVADGGSTDATRTVAQTAGARVVDAPRGRGPQLAAGCAAASADWLLLLHADTRPEPGWAAAVAAFAADPDNAARAGYFSYALDDDRPQARRLERMVAWRCRVLGLPYGDQGLLIRRAFLEGIGGVAPLPLMEDVDLARRIGRRRLVPLGVSAVTSAERYRDQGYWRRPLRNLALLGLYFLGVPPERLARLYG